MHSPALGRQSTHDPITPPWAAAVRRWNPLHDDLKAASLSSYHGVRDGRFQPLLASGRDHGARFQRARGAHERISSQILAPGFPCVAARSAINRKTYRFGLYAELGSVEAGLALCHDLYEFAHEFKPGQEQFTSFIAAFESPELHSEIAFEQLLWQQLQRMHEIDARHFAWDASVSKEPDSPNFSFSIGGRAYFVVGMNPAASRKARQTERPCVVFNPHEQFEALRARGKFEPLQEAIRERDMAFQGSINPVLSSFGQLAESRQYSGRAVPTQWKCPFKHEESSS